MSGRPLTSTTAPGTTFASRSELAEHYKSDWHKYNLKRREANMPMLTNDEFSARLEAAMALRREREGREARSGKDHLKDKSATSSKKDKKKANQRISKRQVRLQERQGISAPVVEETNEEETEYMEEETEVEQEEPPEINPKQSLFDKHISEDVKTNVEYMYKKYGFFVPDQEFLIDQEGLIGYCAEKIKVGQTCLYCQKMFRSWRGCQEHMINSRHAKLRYEANIDLEEFDVFYDFTTDNEEFLKSGIGNHKRRGRKFKATEAAAAEEPMEVVDEDEDEWEDVDSDDEMEGDDGIYAAYEDEIAKHGFDISPLGELIFPDGRIIGHRGLSRYYKQRFAPADNRTSTVAARRANGERLFNGRVYDTYAMTQEQQNGDNASTLQLVKAGLSIGAAPGRSGRGILVPSGGGSSGSSYTALSLYRYKAAAKKAKKEEFQGRRLQERTTLPMNKMDKKANRLHNNVSVAHAPR
jgi:pre-60S factor REI1